MTDRQRTEQDRIDALLIEQAIDGLNDIDKRELEGLLSAVDATGPGSMEEVVAMIDQACGSDDVAETLPPSLRDRLTSDARYFFQSATPSATAKTPPVVIRFARAGWFAAAASIVIAILGWWQVIMPDSGSAAPTVNSMAAFTREHDDAVTGNWSSTIPEYANVSGELVWSDSEQTGYMRFVGLASNDPAQAQYQLWIVDPQRDEHPIDGGVFDVASDGEVVVPIDAKLLARAPKVFAITKEQPGGVVVSDGPLILVAKIEG